MKQLATPFPTLLKQGARDTLDGVKRRWMYILVMLAAVLIDQLTKYLAVTYLRPITDVPLWDGVLHLHYTTNPGAAFGMMGNSRWIFIAVSALSIPVMLMYLFIRKGHTPLFDWGLAMVVGGGIGNMIDRVGFGMDPEKPSQVVDFIYFKLIDFAIFNGADTFVCVGAGLIILALVLDIVRAGRKHGVKDDNH